MSPSDAHRVGLTLRSVATRARRRPVLASGILAVVLTLGAGFLVAAIAVYAVLWPFLAYARHRTALRHTCATELTTTEESPS